MNTAVCYNLTNIKKGHASESAWQCICMRFEIRKHRMQFKHEKDIFDGCSINDTEQGELVTTCKSFRSALKFIQLLGSVKFKEETYNSSVWVVEEFAIHPVDEDGEPVEDELNYYTSSLPIE